MKNYAGNRTLLIVMQNFFFNIYRIISTPHVCQQQVSLYLRQEQTSPIPLEKILQIKNEWGESD